MISHIGLSNKVRIIVGKNKSVARISKALEEGDEVEEFCIGEAGRGGVEEVEGGVGHPFG